jgi:hypothetical protein
LPHRSRAGVVDQGGHQNAEADGEGFLQACGQNEREQLRFVTHFCQGNNTGRDEKGFHVRSRRVGEHITDD